MRSPTLSVLAIAVVASGATAIIIRAQEGVLFRGGVELVNVTATVADEDGHLVSHLRKEDFAVYEDGKRQHITHFSNERVPVSLGIALDASGSMTADKMAFARAAIDRFIYDLLDTDDELFFLEFANSARITQGWTTDRRAISRAVSRVVPVGGTAMYDAIAEALPAASAGRNRKKAIIVISDGNDTNSHVSVAELRRLIREGEVIVYALGVDSTARSDARARPNPRFPPPIATPFPFPGGRRPEPRMPPIIPSGTWSPGPGDRVNGDALRQITDDTGGRTEIVRGFEGLDTATSRLADELSQQYYLGYSSTARNDGRWHAIRVEVRERRLTVRARRGYVAS